MKRKTAGMSSVIGQYISAAEAHGMATDAGDHREANRQHRRIMAALRQLRVQGEGGERALLGILEHNNEHVRGWAASHLLGTRETERAKQVLTELARGSSFSAFNAEMVLGEWEKGTLKT